MSPTRLPQQPETPHAPGPLQGPDEPVAVETRQPKVGEQFDKYQLLARLATGGMAELFVARLIGASGFRKNVVIKRILPHVAHDENFTRMFLDEAITCAQINHPNVCQVFELCESEDTHFLVLEHLEGATVGNLIRRCVEANQQVNLNLAAGIIVQACDGLHAAHEQVDADDNNVGLVHRDVSPGNLFVTVDGIVKLLDFGIAKAAWMSRKTRTGTLLGKCEYMSPEQARGSTPVDRRSDIFSLGVIAWEMLCGRRLFRRESEYETLRAVLRAPIERPRDLRPTVPVALDNAIMRALERDPDDRFRNAHEFRTAINDALQSKGGPTPMCDIAPIIRASFAEQLRMQRGLIKKATLQTQQEHVPGLRKVPRGTMPGTQGKGSPEEATEVRPRPEASLPSLAPAPSDETSSMELTFRVIPSTPPRGARLVPVVDKVSSKLIDKPKIRATPKPSPVTAKKNERSQRTTLPSRPASICASGSVAGASDTKAAQKVAVPTAPSASIIIASTRSQNRQQLILLLIVGLLGAALAATLATVYYGGADQAPASATAKVVETPPVLAPATKTPSPPPTKAPALATADENEKAQAQALAANTQGRNAIVTSLSPTPAGGTVSIRSSKPATIYLYPSKRIIGTTPLVDFAVPAGTHKFKAQIGEGKGKRKYFHLKVEAGKSATRSFTHW